MKLSEETFVNTHFLSIKKVFRKNNIEPDDHISWLKTRLNNDLGKSLIEINRIGIPEDSVYKFIDNDLEKTRVWRTQYYCEQRSDVDSLLDECGGITYDGFKSKADIARETTLAKKIAYDKTVQWYKKRVLRQSIPSPK